MVQYNSTVVSNGATLDDILSYASKLELNGEQPIGFLWNPNSSSPTLQRIDINGSNFTPSSNFFDNWRITGGMRKCVRNRSTGVITYGKYNRGDNLDLTGAAGDVLVELPTCRYKFTRTDGDYREYFFVPYTTEETRFSVHPVAVQRGGVPRNRIYVGAYEASLYDNNGTLQLTSVSGAQPWTGGQIRSLAFNTGTSSWFTIGETLTGASSGKSGIVVGYHKSSGAWGTDAAGTVYLSSPGIDASTVTGFTTSESLNSCAKAGGAATTLTFALSDAETYANAIGSGFGVCNIWTHEYIQALMYLEYGTFNLQAALGNGVVSLGTGNGFAGLNTGACNINSNLSYNGTGVGTGTNGFVPVTWRNIENPYGNVSKNIIGLNMISDGTYHILKRDGTGTPSQVLTSGSYESGAGVPVSADNYISGLMSDELGALAFIPSAVAGSTTTYLCDEFAYARNTAPGGSLQTGGYWDRGLIAGIGCKIASNSSSVSSKSIGVRIEYIPQS